MKQTKKGLAAFWIIIIVFLILVLGFGAWWVWRFFLSEPTSPIPTLPGETATTTTASAKIDSALVGTWESDCLVPDPNSKWAEQHFFTIKSDSPATHVRKSYFTTDCTTLQPELIITDTFKITIPATGQINLTWTALDNAQLSSIGMSATDYIGKTQYDIYKVSGNTLMLGEGFRNNQAYTGPDGMSEANRFTTLNEYIVYKKK